MANYFSTVGISSIPPIGGIIAYCGDTDPVGWVICDGVQRDNSGGKYNNLLSINIGIFSGNNYTPPDLRGAFLRGSNKGTNPSSATSGYQSYALSLNSFQTHATQTHNHSATINDPGHNHIININDPGHKHFLGFAKNSSNDDGATVAKSYPGAISYTGNSITGITANSASSTSNIISVNISNQVGNIDPNETRPYNYNINWILRY